MAKVPIMQIWDDATQQYVAIPSIQGAKGDTGFSPTVSISAIPGGHRVTITDKAGSQSFDVMDGESGDGNGDMNAATYDPQGKAQDIFAYADAKQAKITASGILKGDGSGGVSAAVKGTDYAGPSVGVSATLSASGWDADAKTQTVSVAGVTAAANGSLRIAQSATDEQFAAWGAAQPRVTAQADGSITVKLAGTVPTMDIPVEVLIV